MTSLEKKGMEPVESVPKIIYQSNTYRKDLSWSHFDDEPRVPEKQQVKGKQSCIFVFVACLPNPSSNWGHQPRRDNIFHTWAYGRFLEIQSNLRRKKLHRIN